MFIDNNIHSKEVCKQKKEFTAGKIRRIESMIPSSVTILMKIMILF